MPSKPFLLTVAVLSALAATAAYQAANPQPGRNRSDAPAQHEEGRRNITLPARSQGFMNPRVPEADPPPDPRIRSALRMTDDTRADDFPHIASNPINREEVWCVWQSYSGRQDQVRLSRYDPNERNWGAWSMVPGSAGDVWRPQVIFDAKGRLWVIWSMQVQGNFDLYARWYDGSLWGPLERLTAEPQSDFDHRVAAGPNGRLWVSWQGFRNGQSDIFLAQYDGVKWQPAVKISESARNDWAPAVAADSKGNVVVAWDSYDKGNYDVLMRRYSGGALGPVEPVAATARLEARPTVAFDKKDRLWIAFEAGPVNWGKDWGAVIPDNRRPGAMLFDERMIVVAAYEGGRKLGLAPDLGAKLPRRNPKVYVPRTDPIHYDPQLLIDDLGRVNVLFRNQRGSQYATFHRTYAATLGPSGWDEPAPLPYSEGRVSMRAAAAPAPGGGLWVAWPRDNDPKFSIFINLPEETLIENVYTARYEPQTASGDPKLEQREIPVPAPPAAGHADEDKRVAAIRAWRSSWRGKNLRILRGDLHRHTEMSPDLRGTPDGSILDFYRYMMDAAAMDFGIISDHQNGGDREYWWWLEEKTADLFHAPPNYIPLFGYERSVTYPNGHRNVIHARRGLPPVPFFQQPDTRFRFHNGAGAVIDGDTKMLYEELRRSGGLAISHTSATTMGTDWRDNDKEIEPVVEIFQGDRYSYECDKCPLSDNRNVPDNDLQARRPAGFVQNAWAKGYRLGVIASSDHLSTHLSYAMVYAEEATREAIHNAIRQRRTYGATDNIIVDFRIGSSFMGEEIQSAATVPPVTAKIAATGGIREVALIRNNKVIFTTQTADLRYQDRSPERGLNWYYVRVWQQDNQIAWSSPIWINVK
jgi:hypothetical protein